MPELVSIIIPTFNRAHLIGETIQSVIDQSYVKWELIIVDDGSTDNTKDRVAEFKDDRINYFHIEHSGIIGAVRNFGMRKARGEFVAFLDSDDLWLPNKLEYQLGLFQKNLQVAFVFGHGEHFGLGATPTPSLEKFFAGRIYQPFLFERRFIFYVPTLLFKKKVIDEIGAIDEKLFYAGDIDFFLRMAYTFDGVFNNNIVAKIRKQEKSHSQSNELKAYDDYLTLLNKHLKESRLTSKQFSQLAFKHHYQLGLIHSRFGEFVKARTKFKKCIQLNPMNWKGWIRFIQSFFKTE